MSCNTGAFGEALRQASPAFELWGIEPDAGAASRARERVDPLIVGLFDPASGLPATHFDVLVFNDVLEPMVDPWTAPVR